MTPEAERYRLLVELAQDQIFVIGRDDRVEYVNRTAADRLGEDSAAIVGRPRADFFPPPVAEKQKASLDAVFATGEPQYVEAPSAYQGRQVWLGTWLTPVKDEAGRVTSVLGSSRDITDRRQLEEELARARVLETLGRLTGGIAHAFNNYLTAILGYVEILLVQVGDDGPLTRDLREVERAAQRAAGLVRRLLAFGRREIVEFVRLDLNRAIGDLRPMLERLIGEHIQMTFALAPDLPAVSGDAGQFEQILMNLSLNARDAMPAGGVLRVETRSVAVASDTAPLKSMPPGSYVVLTVADTGSGMDVETQARLFEPFFTTKPRAKGTGLGLPTVYGIVKQVGGFIFVDSEVGRGTTFTLYLPAVAAPAVQVEAVRAGPVPAAAATEHDTVLLVEDDENVRRFTRLVLERHGVQVLEAASADEALAAAAARTGPIDLLLSDVVMPGRSGPELADEFARIRPGVPVLFMSGYPADRIRRAGPFGGREAQMLTKPFTSAELLAAIERVLGRA
jgi:PAS domain S-box-containing protein